MLKSVATRAHQDGTAGGKRLRLLRGAEEPTATHHAALGADRLIGSDAAPSQSTALNTWKLRASAGRRGSSFWSLSVVESSEDLASRTFQRTMRVSLAPSERPTARRLPLPVARSSDVSSRRCQIHLGKLEGCSDEDEDTCTEAVEKMRFVR